jgi:hypothetical protein
MRRVLPVLCAVVIGALSVLAPSAGADPTNHFDVSFTIICGGKALVIVAKPGSSNVVTVNGQPSTQVSVLFGLHVTDNLGNVIIDFRKPGNQPVQTCTDTSWPTGWTATAETIITPVGHS